MSLQWSPILKLDISDVTCLETKFLYPKLVLFESTQNFCILDLDCKSVKISQTIEENDVILDKALLEGFFWYILRSGNISIINLLKGTKVELIDVRYKFSQLKVKVNELFLITESAECLKSPYTIKEIHEKIEANETELLASFKKVNTNVDMQSYIEINGLQIFNEDGIIKTQCPVTGLKENISTNVMLEYVLSWDSKIIIANKSNMWVIDLVDSSVIFEFGPEKTHYHPLGVHNNTLYYIAKDLEQIQIHCAWISTGETIQDKDVSNNFTPTLTSQESLKSQLKLLVQSVLESSKLVNVPSDIQILFEKINDFDELINVGIKLCQHNIIFKSLMYSLQIRIYDADENNYKNIISDLIIKVDLIEYIMFREIHTYDNVNLFIQNYKDLSMMFLSYADVDLATVCWLKYSCMELSISSDDILDILNSVPYNTKIGAIVIWLRNFAPPLLEKKPFYVEIFIRWSTERVFQLEKSTYWPKIGVKFIEAIISILESSFKTISVRPIAMDDLDTLKDQINYIFELKEKYKINILLSEFNSQSSSEVSLIMLRRCYTEDLKHFIQDFLLVYASRDLLEFDGILSSFIDSEVAVSGGEVDGVRLQVSLDAFNTPGNKLDCLLQVLKVLDVPWNKTVLELATAAAASAIKDFTLSDSEKAIAQEIQKELNYASVKVILKKYNFPITCTDCMILLHKVVNAPIVDLNDLTVLKNILSTNTNYVNILYLNRCLQDSEIKIALDYLNNLPVKEKNIVLKSAIAKFEQIIDSNATDTTIERNYLDFIKGTKLLNDIQMEDLNDLYKFKNYYGSKFSINDINIERFYGDEIIPGSLTHIVITHQSTCSNLMTLLQCTSTSHQVRDFVAKLLSSSKKSNDCFLSIFDNGNNFPILIESYNVLTELATKCKEEHLHYLIEQLAVLNALIKNNTVLKNLSSTWKYQYIYLPVPSNTSINDLITFYKVILSLDSLKLDTVEDNDRCDFNVFRVISHVASSANANINIANFNDSLFHLKDTNIRILLKKIISAQNFDELLITCLLLILKTIESTDDHIWILDVLTVQNNILSPVINSYISSLPIGRTFALDAIVNSNSVSFSPQYILKNKFNIELSDLPEHAEETWNDKVVILYVLKQYPEITSEHLVDLCNIFNVSVNYGLSLQLVSLLSSWELNYKVCQDEFGCRQIIVQNDDRKPNDCFTIWENIVEKDFVTDILTDFWKNGEVTLHGRVISINAYYYEVFLCIYHLLFGSKTELKDMKDYFLLNFLKYYKRSSAPKQYEFEQYSTQGIFPEIGYFRLPFHLFMREDMWSNLKSEITLDSYECWLPIVALLSLDSDWQTAKDMVCSNAVKQTMTSRKRNEGVDNISKEYEPWRLIAKEEPLLRAAHRCVRHIANMEWAGACLFYVLQGCTRGADQVAAAHLCYQFSQRWAALQPGNRAVRQMERLHATLSTRHVLYKIEWACEELLRLSTEPTQLIRALYSHPDFIKKIARFDVNKAANEIADKNNVNINSIRIQILENLLEKNNQENKIKDFSTLNAIELIMAKYILKATCPKMGAIYLSRIVFDEDCSNNKCKKLRALQCLLSIIESDTAIRVTNRDRDALWVLLLDLLCIVNLENNDLPWIVKTFRQDKIHALEQLVQTAEGNPACLKTATLLALRFGTPKMINDLINLLLRGRLYKEIVSLLLKVSTNPPNNIICAAWRTVILTPFQNADYPISEHQRVYCLNAVNLLPVCPIIKDEDLKEIWKNCLRCKCLGLGCLILPYMTSQTRQTLTEFAKIDRRNLISSLKNLHTDSFLVAGAMHVIENMAPRTYR